MKARYERPPTRDEVRFRLAFVNYTRGCVAAAAIRVLYYEFGFSNRARIPRFVAAIREELGHLDEEYGWDEQKLQNDILRERMKAANIDYGERHLAGSKAFSGYVHDNAYMVCMLVLMKKFGFGCKRTEEGRADGESRLSRYFDSLQATVARINHINDGWCEGDPRVIKFDEYLRSSLESMGLTKEFIEKEVFSVWVKTKKRGSGDSSTVSTGTQTSCATIPSAAGEMLRSRLTPTPSTRR